jgi:hypothetical protein
MPSAQRGTLAKRGDRWSARWRDETGKPRRRTFAPGREGKAEAQAFLEPTLREVDAHRNGDPVAVRRHDLPTLGELVAEYVGQHSAEPNTIRTLAGPPALRDRGAEARWRGRLGRPAHRPPHSRRDRRLATAPARSLGARNPQGAAAGPPLRRSRQASRREPSRTRAEPGAEAPRGPRLCFARRARGGRRRTQPGAPAAAAVRRPHRPAPAGMACARARRPRPRGRPRTRSARVHRWPGEALRQADALASRRAAANESDPSARGATAATRYPPALPRRPRWPPEPQRLALRGMVACRARPLASSTARPTRCATPSQRLRLPPASLCTS